ncbi:hypothetical protein CEE37_08065 [candidate division LCP-89 bacterium B3_LCP]|uniref:Spore protein YkvP/CgeB glycosyl transferase-like domain-containing protein n=1 Tax=candidate division LCP-89 bacterium B3_LCP TaxID=2012998 RepID=A0A532UZE5_UNCL8|nr:MAG: hypothetical protein CEE37_08065 [candidate division LCP-89 bacterium B3_LCP]
MLTKSDNRNNSCILLIDSGYFLIKEVKRALQAQGCRAVTIPLNDVGESGYNPRLYSLFLNQIIDAYEAERPDFLLTINHLGFDQNGRLTELLEALSLPGIVWYVDSPRYILLNHLANVSDNIGIFLWEAAYESWLRQMGYKKIETLPLATDPDTFCHLGGTYSAVTDHSSNPDSVVFVGDSMDFAVVKAFSKLPQHLMPDSTNPDGALAAELTTRFCQTALSESFQRNNAPWEIYSEIAQGMGYDIAECSPAADSQSDQLNDLNLESALVLMATRQQRHNFLRDLTGSDEIDTLQVYGDEGWKKILNGKTSVLPPVDYYRKLPNVYRDAGAVLNLTSMQMPTALNQRCYDVPAAGGFVITDQQRSIQGQFELEKEIVTFNSTIEFKEKWRFYKKNPTARQAVIDAGRERVLQEHTYSHRIAKMNSIVRNWFS